MFNAILNKIAERSQALKDKDAEIAVWQETATEQETRINLLIEDGAFRDERIESLKASEREANARAVEASARADKAESLLHQIAAELGIKVDNTAMSAADKWVQEVAAADAAPDAPANKITSGELPADRVPAAAAPDAPTDAPAAEEEVEAPATEA